MARLPPPLSIQTRAELAHRLDQPIWNVFETEWLVSEVHLCAGLDDRMMLLWRLLAAPMVIKESIPAPPFDPRVFLANANGGRKISPYKQNEQGEPADSVFYVQQGKVKLTVVSEQGKEAVVAILGRGDFCGEGCLAAQARRMATAAALEDSTIMRLEKGAMIRLLHDEPEFSARFMSHLLARNIRIEEDLVDQLFNSSEKRLARLPLILANFGKEGKPEPVIAKISQETLAEMIGTTRSRVSSFMNKFRKLGLINYNGHLEVHSSLLNVVLHDDPHINRDPAGSGESSTKATER